MRKLLVLLSALLALPAFAADRVTRTYGVATTIDFEIYAADGTLSVSETDGGTDVTLTCDEGTPATATNDYVDEGAFYSIALTATEMQCARLGITIAGSAVTTNVFAETIGNASAGIPAPAAGVVSWNGVLLATTNPLPNAAPDAAGGLPISDAGGLDLDVRLNHLDADMTSRLAPTTPGRTADVTATGAVGIDWANVENPTATVGLSNTTVATSTNLTNAPTVGDFTTTMKTSLETAATNVFDPTADTVTLSTSVNNCRPAMGCSAQGMLSGTHSTTTADLGTNAPGATSDVVGKTLIIPAKYFSRVITAYDTGTGVATFDTTSLTLADADQWYLYETPPAPVVEPNGSITQQCALAALLSYAAGTLSTSGGTATYKDPSGTTTRITGTYSAGGNRSSITITCP